MVIYGSRSTHLKSESIPLSTCSSCNTQGSFVASVFGKYAHVFWIPLFPIGKVAVAECQHCKKTFRDNELPTQLQSSVWGIKSSAKTPIWNFAGLAIIGGLIAFMSIFSSQHEKDEVGFKQNPMAKDKYSYKTDEGSNSMMIVDKVTADPVFVFYNTMEIDSYSKLYKIDKEENYDNVSYGISRAELKAKFDSDVIYNIDRP